jgi:uncharacterized protein
MKYLFATVTAALLISSFALAQTPAQSAPPVQHQPGVAAPPSTRQMQQSQAPAQAQQSPAQKVDPQKEKAIRHLMDLNGTSKLGDNMTEAVSFQVKNAMSRSLAGDRLQKFMEDFNQKLGARSAANDVTSVEISTYAQHFSLEDLQGMIQFYESPVGQHMAKALPEVMQESQKTAADIEKNAALATLKDMSGDYPELKPMLPSDQPRPSLGPGAQQQQPKPQGPEQQPQAPNPQKPQQ